MRRAAVMTALVAALVALTAGPAAAHGIGGRQDLPVPLSYFIVGAGTAIVISFVALSASWREPRLQDGPGRRELRSRVLTAPYRLLPAVGLGGLLLVVTAGLIDGTESPTNVAPVLVWVYFWLVVPFLGALVGDLWRWMSPFRLIGRWVNADRPERPELLDTVGYLPAAAAFVAFTWLELVWPDSSLPRTLALAAIVYTLYKVAITWWAGPETGIAIGGAFATYNHLFGAMAPIAAEPLARVGVGAAVPVTRAPVTVVRRGWLRALPSLPARRGLTTFVVAMIGTVTYDGMSGTDWWRDWFGDTAGTTWFGTVALLATVAVIGAGYWAACAAAGRLAASQHRTGDIARSFAHTLVPIAFAYAFAHYFTLVIFEGQGLLHAISDPFGLGWNLFGTAEWTISYALIQGGTTWVWYVQVAAIVAGHVGGVVLAHDRALADFGDEVAVRTQYAMLALMVALTSLGLFVLAG
jgi:hypothetical protein